MNEPSIRVLLLDDDEDEYLIHKKLLASVPAQTYELVWVSRIEEALARLTREAFDVVLVDYRLGEHTGVELIRKLVGSGLQVPCILLTGCADRQVDLEATRAGAVDFLDKCRIDSTILERSIRYALERARTLEALRAREQQLLHAQKMEAIGRLAGGMAHDFNHLLTAIEGYSELAAAQLSEDDPVRSDILEIQSAARRAEALARRLLTLSQGQILKPAPQVPNDLIEKLTTGLREVLGEKIQLETQLEARSGRVLIDGGQFDQLVLLLAANARDAMYGTGELVLSTAEVSLSEPLNVLQFTIPSGCYVRLSVRDNGRGMNDEVLAHLFEPFYAIRVGAPGSGLGLSIVYAIVKQSNGHIAVSSEVGKGTRVDIYFPRVQDQAASRPSDRPPSRRAGPERVLVVEDEAPLRNLASRVLKHRGCDVVEATNGAEALEIVEREREPFDIVLSDVVMPRMDGVQLAKRVADIAPSTAVILMSGYSDRSLDVDTPENCAAVLHKPFTVTQLVETVEGVSSTSGLAPSLEERRRAKVNSQSGPPR